MSKTEGRDSKGRWLKGHSGNKGPRGPHKYPTGMLAVLRKAVTKDDWRAIVGRAVKQAKAGDPQARKWLSEYLLGRPTQTLEVEAMISPMSLEDWLKRAQEREEACQKD